MSKLQNNSSFYQGRYIQLYDQKTRNRQKASTSSTQHLFQFESNNNSPQKQAQKHNFQNSQLSLDQQLRKMATNHFKIMQMMEDHNGKKEYQGFNDMSPKKYDNFNPEKYIDNKLLSGRKEKSIYEIQTEYQNKSDGVGHHKQNVNNQNINTNGFNGFDKLVQNRYNIQSKPFNFNQFQEEINKKQYKQAQPKFENSFRSTTKDNSIQIKTKTQYYNFNQTPSRSKSKISQSPQKMNSQEIYNSIEYFSRPSSQYIRMPQSFNQQFPQFFHASPMIVQRPQQPVYHHELVGATKPSSPEVIITRPSIPRAPKTATLGSHKKITYTYDKPLIRQKSNSKQRKLNLSINTINDEKISNNSFNSKKNINKVQSNSGSIQRKRRPSFGGGIKVTLMRK